MQSEPKNYRPGQWVVLGVALGAFIGLLVGKFAIGLIIGFFVGVAVDSAKRKASSANLRRNAGDGDKS
jgi:uncharacterized protein YqgC (DUF456 family)